MKRGLLIIAILLGLIIFKDIPGVLYIIANADTIVPNYGIDINSSNFDGYKYLGNSKDGSAQNARIEIYQDSLNALDYNFIIIDVCATNDIKVSRTASVGNSCTNSCISNAIGITKTTLNCKSNGYDGYIYRVNGSILKWYIGSGSSTIYSLNDQISLVNDKSNNVPISIYGVYISDSETIQNITFDYTQNFNNVINNQNQNSQNIINNQNQNTQDIVNNQNQNTQAQIESQKVCNEQEIKFTKDDIYTSNKYLNSNGEEIVTEYNGITNYIEIENNTTYTVKYNKVSGSYFCLYNENKVKVDCIGYNQRQNFTFNSSNAKYVRFTLSNNNDTLLLMGGKICKNGNQAIIDEDHSYNDNPSETIDGQQDIDNLKEAEEDLMNSLDFSGANNLNVTINPNASNFIWQIVENLRNMNASIVLLWTSILGLGIIKLVLNR